MGKVKHDGEFVGERILGKQLHERIICIRQQNYRDGLTGETWNRKQFFRLCRLLRCQPEEIAERYFIPFSALSKWLKSDEIPPYVSLHFVLLERSYFLCSSAAKMKPEPPTAPRHD